MLTALATPTIAYLVYPIGREQKEIAARKLRLDLFEKKFAVYRGVVDLISAVINNRLTEIELTRFRDATAGAVFLFSEDVENYVREMR